MSTYQAARDRFLIRLTSAPVIPWSYADVCALFRLSATAQRLAVAQCNGDWPADNGTGGETCPACESVWRAGMTGKGAARRCPDCRNVAALRALVANVNGIRGRMADLANVPQWYVEVSGDPRGHVVKLIPPNGNGDRDAIGVPVRG